MLAHYANVSSGLWCCSGWFIKWKERGKWEIFLPLLFSDEVSNFFMNISLCLLPRTLFNPNQRHSQKHFGRWKKNIKLLLWEKIFSFQTSMNPLRVNEMSFTGFYEMNFYICNLIFSEVQMLAQSCEKYGWVVVKCSYFLVHN